MEKQTFLIQYYGKEMAMHVKNNGKTILHSDMPFQIKIGCVTFTHNTLMMLIDPFIFHKLVGSTGKQ